LRILISIQEQTSLINKCGDKMINKLLTRKTVFFVLALTLGSFLMQSCHSNKPVVADDANQKFVISDSLLKTIKIDTVQTCQLVNSVALTGQVDFNQDNEVNIFPLVSGNVEDVKAELGDYVNAGQVLAVVQSSEMAGYSNNLASAQANLSVTKKNLDAQQELFKSGLASQLDVTSAQANYDQAVAQLQMVQRVLKINGDNVNGDYIIKAPISGFIVQKNITNSTVIRADNNNVVFAISDLKNVWVWANVYESNIGNIHLGDAVDVTTLSYPGRVFQGKVDKILNVLDPTSKVMKVRIALSNDDYALKPQMYASVVVTNKEDKEALCISSDALIFDHSQYYILKYNSQSDVQITPVQVINTVGNRTFIAAGVQPGDKIIASEALLIYSALNS
jgi:membrane fusion protein, heavy metal efflux system